MAAFEEPNSQTAKSNVRVNQTKVYPDNTHLAYLSTWDLIGAVLGSSNKHISASTLNIFIVPGGGR